ncbi:hypothetical protein ACFE04_000443 [Oxalis oulophora]
MSSSVARNLISRELSQLRNKTRQYLIPHTNNINPYSIANPQKPICDVFINHRGLDTKRTVAGLLHYEFSRLGLEPFLDSKNMKPGDRLYDTIHKGIRDCKIGVSVFSPGYCESYFCLHELALLMESKKRVIPIFCDVKPSSLEVKDDGTCSKQKIQRFKWALEEAKFTVGLTFDTLNGDWSEFLATARDAVIENLIEAAEEEQGPDNSPMFVVNE